MQGSIPNLNTPILHSIALMFLILLFLLCRLKETLKQSSEIIADICNKVIWDRFQFKGPVLEKAFLVPGFKDIEMFVHL